VREVGVHLDDPLGASLERAREARDVGRAQARLARPVQGLDARVLGRERIRDRPGAVGDASSTTRTCASGTAASTPSTTGPRVVASS
jgi:hypothetical protein